MAKFRQGDIVLIPYPYTDLSGTKKRPVVVISKTSINNENLIVAKITSVIRNDIFSVNIKPGNINNQLKYNSEVRTNEIFTVNKSLVIKRFATFYNGPLKLLINKISENFSPV